MAAWPHKPRHRFLPPSTSVACFLLGVVRRLIRAGAVQLHPRASPGMEKRELRCSAQNLSAMGKLGIEQGMFLVQPLLLFKGILASPVHKAVIAVLKIFQDTLSIKACLLAASPAAWPQHILTCWLGGSACCPTCSLDTGQSPWILGPPDLSRDRLLLFQSFC